MGWYSDNKLLQLTKRIAFNRRYHNSHALKTRLNTKYYLVIVPLMPETLPVRLVPKIKTEIKAAISKSNCAVRNTIKIVLFKSASTQRGQMRLAPAVNHEGFLTHSSERKVSLSLTKTFHNFATSSVLQNTLSCTINKHKIAKRKLYQRGNVQPHVRRKGLL